MANVFDVADFGFDQIGPARPRHYGVTVRCPF